MTTVKQLANALENISIQSEKSDEKKAYILPLSNESAQSKLSNQDEKLERLLELLEKYEELTIGDFRLNYINGMLNLTRSNYNTGQLGKKYGADSYDLRCRTSCVEVGTTGGRFELRNLLAEQKLREKKERRDRKAEEAKMAASKAKEDAKTEKKDAGKAEKEDETLASSDIEESTAKIASGAVVGYSKVKSRHDKQLLTRKDEDTKKDDATTTIEPVEKVVDPIHQFGGLVPYQLRSSQEYFSAWLGDCVKMINLQRKMNELVSELSETAAKHGVEAKIENKKDEKDVKNKKDEKDKNDRHNIPQMAHTDKPKKN